MTVLKAMKKSKNIIPKDTCYIPLTQQPWCCVPTCFQMVMLRYKIPLVPAELMAYHMQVVVPKRDKKLFFNIKTTKKKTKKHK